MLAHHQVLHFPISPLRLKRDDVAVTKWAMIVSDWTD